MWQYNSIEVNINKVPCPPPAHSTRTRDAHGPSKDARVRAHASQQSASPLQLPQTCKTVSKIMRNNDDYDTANNAASGADLSHLTTSGNSTYNMWGAVGEVARVFVVYRIQISEAAQG